MDLVDDYRCECNAGFTDKYCMTGKESVFLYVNIKVHFIKLREKYPPYFYFQFFFFFVKGQRILALKCKPYRYIN